MNLRHLDPAVLREHDAFLRRLAGTLVRDPGVADDAVQDAWVEAVERPSSPWSLRGWLAAATRSRARDAARAAERRGRRERAVARPEGAPSLEDVREREAARRLVVDAVLGLDEPYRDVVLLRFYEGLPPREVARRLGIPVETVRTRARRAVERLRADLDRRHGARAAWVGLVTPLSRAGGILAVSTSAKVVAGALVVLVALGAAWFVAGGGDREKGGTEPPILRSADDPAVATRSPASMLEGRGGEGSAPSRGVDAAAEDPRAGRALGRVQGVVLSGRTHEPVADAAVTLTATQGALPDGMSVARASDAAFRAATDARGRFRLDAIPLGAYRVDATHPVEGVADALTAAAADPPWIRLYAMPARPEARTLSVRVLDAKRRPVAGATVECVQGVAARVATATTDAEGLATFADLDLAGGTAQGWLTARAEGAVGRVGFTLEPWRRTEGGPREIVLDAPGAVAGVVRTPAGVSPAGLEVEVWSMAGGQGTWATGVAQRVRTGGDGAFRVDGVPAGEVAVLVREAGELRMDLERRDDRPDDWRWPTVRVEAGREARAEVRLVRGGALLGRVRRADGTPVAGARVEVHLPQGPQDYVERVKRAGVPLWRLDSAWPDARRPPLTFRVLATDATGAYEATGLLPGPYRVRVLPGAELSFDVREPVVVEDGVALELEHRIVPAGTLELVAPPFEDIGLRREGDGAVVVAMVSPQGSTGALVVPGLAAGRWELLGGLGAAGSAPRVLAAFEVRPGRTTYLDVADGGDARVRLRLLDRGLPVAGAWIGAAGMGWSFRETDAEGRVAWGATTPGPGARDGVGRTSTTVELPGDDAPALVARFAIGTEEVDLGLPSGSLVVRVLDGAGRTAARAAVVLTAQRADERAPWSLQLGTRRFLADAAGTLRVRNVPPGRYRLTAELGGSGGTVARETEVADGPVEVELRAAPTGSARVVVRDANGHPRAGVKMGAAALPAADDPGVDAKDRWKRAVNLTKEGMQSGPDGTLRLEGLPVGTARVYAWVLDAAGWAAVENAQGEVAVREGEQVEVVLTLAPVGGGR